MNNETTKRNVTRDDNTMTFIVTCASRDAKNDVFDVCEQHNIDVIVYRAQSNDDTKRNASITRQIARCDKLLKQFALRASIDNNKRDVLLNQYDSLLRDVATFDAMTNDDAKLSHIENVANRYNAIYKSMM